MPLWKMFASKKKTPQELLAAGDLKGARRAFHEVLKERGFDPNITIQVGDINLKLGNRVEAKKLYVQVGDYYGEQGFFNKSVAVFKKALVITPDDETILSKLASLNDQVPKFMLDEKILERIQDESPAPEQPDLEESPDDEPIPLAQDGAVETDEDHGIDEETLADISEDLSLEFEKDDLLKVTAKRKEPSPDPEPDSPEADDGFEEITDIDTLDLEPTEVNSGETPTAKSPPTQPPKRRTVFSSREESESEPAAEEDLAFTSFDDALDAIFSQGPSQSGDGQAQEHQKHWALFRTMPRKVFMDFVMALESRDYPENVFIVEQGMPGDEMYLLADGQVEVLVAKDGVQTRVAILGEGDFFGEASLLTGKPRNASVKTLKPTSCLLLKKADLHKLAKSHPSVLASIQSIYYTRQKHNASRFE